MKTRTLSAATFWTTMVALFALTLVTLWLGISWINKPFPGFMVNGNLSVTPLVSARWNGPAAGLKALDVVKTVNGVEVKDGVELYRIAERAPLGSTLSLTVVRQEADHFYPHDLQVATQRFSIFDFFGFFLVFWLLGVIHLAIGMAVSLVKPGDAAARAHLWFCGGFGVWYLTNFESSSTFWFAQWWDVSFALLPALTANLAFLIPRTVPVLQRHRWLAPLNWGLGGLLAVAIVAAFHQAWLWPDVFNGLTMINNLAILAIPVSAIWARVSRTSTPVVKNQASIILWGALFAYVPAAIFNQLATSGSAVPGAELTYFTLLFFPATIAYTIVRHRLFGIDVIIKRTLTYALVTAALAAAYFLIIAGIRSLLNTGTELTNVIATAVVAVAFAPVRDRIKSVVDRLFFRTGYDLAHLLTEFGDRARSTFDVTELLRTFVKTVELALYPSYVVVYLRESEHGMLRVRESLGLEAGERPELDPQAPALQQLLASLGAINSKPLDVGVYREVTALPLRLKDELVGLVLVGPRKSDQPYIASDLNLLQNLGQQLGLWVKNAQLFGQLAGQERMKRELEIAHEVQSGLLPSQLPQRSGVELSATSVPALEVGGDFFDVIPLDERRLGILIGDVSGKGVPAALLMAMTVVIFRSIARECPSPAEVMARANELIFLNRPSRKMFVTAFYAVYDTEERMLTYTNAGNPYPIGTTGRLEAKGISLGMFASASYEERQARLHPGEMVLMYSDGAEDAVDMAHEQFGEERLVQLMHDHAGLPPHELQEKVLSTLRDFADGAPQFDDITLVALKATA